MKANLIILGLIVSYRLPLAEKIQFEINFVNYAHRFDVDLKILYLS